jgi:AraC-like DNA-binding protein
MNDREDDGTLELGHAAAHGDRSAAYRTDELSTVAAQLTEAAYRARHGDRDATRAHIAQAIALLGAVSHRTSRETLPVSKSDTHVVRGGLPAWQARRLVSHVNTNLSRRIPVQELARLLGLSASHFCRAFKCTFGVAPRLYVLRRRIEAAQGLMLTTPEPLSSIAIRCGLCDQPHFTRSFRRIVGETPYMWRRARRPSPGSK